LEVLINVGTFNVATNIDDMKQILGLLIVVLLLSGTPKPEKTMKLYYVYDGLCGWCYGFSPVITAFDTKYNNELAIEAIPGGMITGDRVGPIGEVLSFLSPEDFKRVEDYTGVRYGKNFMEGLLKDGTSTFTSIPSATALMLFKELKPADQVAFAGELLKMVYQDGHAPMDYTAYGTLAEQFGLDATDFSTKMQEDKYLKAAEQAFVQASNLGVNGYPTLILEEDGKRIVIARGYVGMEQLEKNFLAGKQQLGKAK
jgi:putative protein-disulfide isomerase